MCHHGHVLGFWSFHDMPSPRYQIHLTCVHESGAACAAATVSDNWQTRSTFDAQQFILSQARQYKQLLQIFFLKKTQKTTCPQHLKLK